MIITTSWDDGHPLDKRLADLLEKHGISATFYIPRKSQLETLDETEVRSLSRRFEVGAHTLDHLALTTLDQTQARHQIDGSKAWVESVIGQPCEMFCPPLGKYTAAHTGMFQSAGFRGYRSVEMGSTSIPSLSHGLIEMATTVQSHPHSNQAYLKNALRRLRFGAMLRTIRLWNCKDWTHRAEHYLSRTTREDVFHLWGHSWEIDQHDQWRPLEVMFKRLGELIASGSAVTRTNGQICAALHPNEQAAGRAS
jgi:peptidoglycan-N-acetylglucosamine deacetylase